MKNKEKLWNLPLLLPIQWNMMPKHKSLSKVIRLFVYLIIYPAVILSTLPFHFQPANKARSALDEADRRLRDQ